MKFLFLALILCLSPCILSAPSTELPAALSKKQFKSKKDNGPDLSDTSVKQTLYPSSVFFTADNTATLYVNGVFQYRIDSWPDFAFKNVNLKNGDVVAIFAQDFGGWWGAVAAINVAGKRFATGGPGWKAVKGYGPINWKLPSFSACSWPDAVVRPGARQNFPGKARYFPYSVDARYVWAEGAGEHDSISMRYTVGETCPFNSRIFFAGDNAATLYVNGVRVRSIDHWPSFVDLTHRLQIGDVVSFVISDRGGWWGGIAAIHYYGRWFVTGRDDFKAVKAFSIPGDNNNAWMLPVYSSCRWPKAVLRPGAGTIIPGKAPGFPYTTGARYVWASDAGEHDTIFVRFVVGGELC